MLTEASNLIVYGVHDPRLAEIRRRLAAVIELAEERYAPSEAAARRPEYERLGLTDAALLDLCAPGRLLATSDLQLHLAAARADYDVLNFQHFRAER